MRAERLERTAAMATSTHASARLPVESARAADRWGRRFLSFILLLGCVLALRLPGILQRADQSALAVEEPRTARQMIMRGEHPLEEVEELERALARPPRWNVYRDGDLVLFVTGRPGPITGSATPPPDGRPGWHPFVTASAVSAFHEHELRTILEASQDVEDYLDRLRRAGFRVERVTPDAR
jgi:hypothetical protein